MAPLITYYGDDFTGASAVMEVLSFAGIPTMLFMDVPNAEVLADYPDVQAIGVAGIARSKDPDWMQQNLPPVFAALDALGAPILHYKTCSTFDSAPHIGSIGKATELGRQVREQGWIPLVVGAPAMGRYQAFGNLFAKAGERCFRLDRHPVMSRHPVTPMDEADLGCHLSHQTDLSVGVVSLAEMKSGSSDVAIARNLAQGADIIALDVVDDETLAVAGRLIWQEGQEPGFAVGSQGVEYALVAHWINQGRLPARPDLPRLAPVDQLFAVSASVAPTTADQIAYAESHGFTYVPFDASTAVDANFLAQEQDRALSASLKALSEGQDVIVASARGPDDPAVARMVAAAEQAGTSLSDARDRLGAALGQLVAQIRVTTGLPRIAIGGGDTSGHALTSLGADALSAVAPLDPGGPLCRVHTRANPQIDGLEVALKGGQIGDPDFFVRTKTGCHS
ncbi:hypothetical protein TRP8649_02030 [Pelagimonas phthalicica]|uniref:Four-carbon acid sugar kinase family protein n=1 Tax=Pelagimonas phthalicica TaxID=1037362 RepID=A0A238JB70_9RHOB|nr:four-carbon acid sugar kinase family protein [Pelagimonas phthalicica]TDS93561.1 uncharacterized protein YgbK (DUF1537 family) [Pelagimonas phthalicica]SMX27918.1 hypothetical protein TRP8649_02030 [Pelagimonas phthalicica]